MEEHPIIRKYVERYGKTHGRRKDLAREAFKKLAEDEDFLREVEQELLPQLEKYRSREVRKHLRTLVDERYMRKRVVALALAIYELTKIGKIDRDLGTYVPQTKINRHLRELQIVGGSVGTSSLKPPLEVAGIARFGLGGRVVVKSVDPDILEGYLEFLAEKYPDVKKRLEIIRGE